MRNNILSFLFLSVLLTGSLWIQPNKVSACERCITAGVQINQELTAREQIIPLVADFGATREFIQDELHFFESRDVVTRYAEIRLDDRMKGSGWIRKNDHILVNLFEDIKLEAHVQRAKENVNGSFSITAVLPDGAGYMVLATTGSRSLGHIFMPGEKKFFKIISDPDTYKHYLIEMDEQDRDILESSPPLIPEEIHEKDIQERERIKNQLKEDDLGPGDVANIGVMVVYTPQAEHWAQTNGGGINNVIAISMANAQLVLDNSQTLMLATLVHSELVDYQESGSSSVDLMRLTTSPDYTPFGADYSGYMEEVHIWRDQHRADLTAIFTLADDTGGMAWLLTNRHGSPNRAFSMTRIQQAATGYTHIHEMGHNMGLHHHADQNFQPGPTNWTNWPDNKWSAGWRWLGQNNARFVSVMSYSGGQYYPDGQNATQVPYFSNPHVVYQGNSTGDQVKADNVHTLLEIKHVIANYRPMGHAGVVTADATNITATTAESGGFIDDIDGLDVTGRGIVWNRSGNPTVNDNEGMTTDGSGTGEFSSQLDDLQPSSLYHVRAYAVTDNSVIHGTHNMFSTLVAYEPSISTVLVEEVTISTALAGGNISFDGNVPVSQRGIVWSKEQNPSISNNEGITKEGPGDGQFMSVMTDLKPETEYYYRAYATNIMGTSYGGQFTFETIGPRIYPNPSAHELWVEFKNEKEGKVHVVLASLQGQVIKRKAVENQGEVSVFFNTSGIRGGMYLVYVEGDTSFPVMRLMIARES